jgi:Raf kinase inhibitor-like YbhB/YbcL family protein
MTLRQFTGVFVVCSMAGCAIAGLGALVDVPSEPAAARVQQRGAPPPSDPPAGQRRGGGGQRGRGAVQVMTLTTSAWTDGGAIPAKHSQAGRDVSPPLTWSAPPDTATSFVLLVHDLDAVTQNGATSTLHWLVWNIPGAARALPEGVAAQSELVDGTRQISQTGPYYRGPAAPASGPPHHYAFELYAVEGTIDVAAVGASPAETRTAVFNAMAGRIRGKATLIGTYRRP